MKLYKIFDKVYRVEIRLMIGTSDELKEYALKYDDSFEDVPEASGRAFRFPQGGILVWLPKFDIADPDDYSLLSHELIHAASFVFDDRKIMLL